MPSDTAPPTALPRIHKGRGGDGTRTVLIADDDEDFRFALAQLMAEEGHRVIDVKDGEAALAVLDAAARGRGRSPDLLVLDLLMPKMSGIEVLQRLRKSARWAKLPVLVMTGVNDPMLRVRLDLPIAFKPDTDVVLEAARHQLFLHRQRQAERGALEKIAGSAP
jgi:CheY-like chemotaxis protein